MGARKNYFNSWKNTISVSFFPLILVVVEELIENEFKCPQRRGLRICYGLSFFIFPALILFVLSLIRQKEFIGWVRYSNKYSWYQHCETVGKGVGSSLLWCVILLIDGRYCDCIYTAFKENSTEPTATTPTQSPSDAYILSQVGGLFVLSVIVLIYCVYTLFPFWSCCKNKEERKNKENQLILEEETEICISKEEKYVQEIVKKILVSKFQDRLKNVSNNLSIKGISEEVKKFINPPATSQTSEIELQSSMN